ncbi:hypothetical protein ACGFYV_27125 [Streptomyces sp. NPDC048297]|uniref:hypothetical protein n=1 Tax=Streptomyces sp. NPDC048297 TaxID=3365531 RepID=UPI0037186636
MGIESDQVVYEYLSRVGDIAQQRQLPSSTRMRLVSELRNEIDRHRAKVTVDSPAAVRRILDRMGSPDEVVEAAGGSAGGAGSGAGAGAGGVRVPQPPAAAVPVQPAAGEREPKAAGPGAESGDGEKRRGLRRVVPRPRPAEPAPPAPAGGASPPHLAPAHELGDSVVEPDWWRVEGSGFGSAGGDHVPGFVGGVEIPDLLKRPPMGEEGAEKEEAGRGPGRERGEEKQADPDPDPDPVVAPRRARRLLPRPAAGWTNPLLLLAAAALVVGAVLGNWFALILGWLIAYGSRRLSPAESKWAVLVIPGLSAASGLLWLWGRGSGRWGDPIAQGHMGDALAETWPWVVRGAAVASAVFLLWRSQRK